MTTTTKRGPITEIKVYWDSQDPANEGWAVRWFRGEHEESESLDGVDEENNLDEAIRDACWQIDINIDIEQFSREPNVDGGFATWTAD